jgi:hypothetical protein
MKKLLILSALMVGLFSCSDDDRLFSDDLTGDKIIGFQRSLVNVTYFEDVGAVTIDLPVILVGLGNGHMPTSDIVVSYSVDTVNSTATEGTEFSFPGAGGQVTIPAGSDFANIPLSVNTGSLNATSATKLVLKLSSPDENIIVGEQYKQIVINFVGCLSQIQEGSYTATMGPESTLGGGTYQDVITMTDTNTFKTLHTPPYLGANEDPANIDYGFTFDDVCGEITVPEMNLFDYYTNLVSGTPYTNDILNNQQGVVVDENTFVIYLKVSGATTYYTFITYTKN